MKSEIELKKILKERFSFDEFKPGQLEILQSLFNQQDTLAILPTGGGKSLIYQFYGEIMQSRILIVSPLISLMQDQVNRMNYLGIKRAITINSSLDFSYRNYVIKNLDRYQYIFVSPETLSNNQVINRLMEVGIDLLVIDEAHCISQWGPDFRPEYLNLGQVKTDLGDPLTLMLTATANEKTRFDILNGLGFDKKRVKIIVNSIDRPNLFINCVDVHDENQKDETLFSILNKLNGSGIIYFSSKSKAEQVSQLINENTNKASLPYHGGMDALQRFKIQQQFMKDEIEIICATSAFGMGIDKSNVRFVVHYHFPANIQDYYQEIGRAGRDQLPCVSILLFNYSDINIHNGLIDNTYPDSSLIHYAYTHPNLLETFKDEKSQLIKFYYDHDYSELDLIELFKQRKSQKQQQLNQMLEYIQYQGCKREWLLNYFGDKKKHDLEFCCNNDSLFNNYLLVSDKLFETGHRTNQSMNWQDKLKKIFLLKN